MINSVAQDPAGWQAGFLRWLPAIETHARIQFRTLRAERREDAIQEAIAAACVSYQTLAAHGRLHVAHAGALADYAVRRARYGRHVGGKRDSARDVLSPAAWRRHGVRVVSYHQSVAGNGREGWPQLAITDRKANIADFAAFRIDFADWLKNVSRRDRKIISSLAGGDATSAVARRFGISASRVSQLRRKFERNWLIFHGEAPQLSA